MAPWPLPLEYQHGTSILWLSPNVEHTYRCVEQLAPENAEILKSQGVQ